MNLGLLLFDVVGFAFFQGGNGHTWHLQVGYVPFFQNRVHQMTHSDELYNLRRPPLSWLHYNVGE